MSDRRFHTLIPYTVVLILIVLAAALIPFQNAQANTTSASKPQTIIEYMEDSLMTALLQLRNFLDIGEHSVYAAGFSFGDRIDVTTNTASGLNVRESANGTIIGGQAEGARGTVTGGPTDAGGYTWYEVNFDSRTDGWVAEDFISLNTTEPTPKPTVTFSVDDSAIAKGQSVTLTWGSADAVSCAGTGSAFFDTGAHISGSVTVRPVRTTQYALTCTGHGGFTTKTVTVRVQQESSGTSVTSSQSSPNTTVYTTYPKKGVSGLSQTPALIWDHVEDADAYNVYLDDSSSLSSNDLIGSTTHNVYFLNDPLRADTRYFWRVDARIDDSISRGRSSYFTTKDVEPSEDRFLQEREYADAVQPTQVQPLQVRGRVRVDTFSDGAVGLNVRIVPSGPKAGGQLDGATGSVTGGPARSGKFIWWQVDFDEGADGWVAAEYIKVASASTFDNSQNSIITGDTAEEVRNLLDRIEALQQQLEALKSDRL